MKKIEIYTGDYREDVERIQRILADRDYEATLSDCERLWEKYSESMCAGWMGLDDKDESVFDCIAYYIKN